MAFDLRAAFKLNDQFSNVVRKSTNEVKKMYKQVEKMNRQLREMNKAAAKAGQTVSRVTQNINRSAQSTRRLSSSFRDAQRNAQRLGDSTSRIRAPRPDGRLNSNLRDSRRQSDGLRDSLRQSSQQLRAVNRQAEQLKRRFDVIGGLGKVGLAIGAPMGALAAGGGVIGTGMAFEKQMSRVGALSGSTNEQLQRLTETARELGKQTKYTATQAGQGMEYLAMAGWKTNQIISAMPGMLNLAAAGAMELDRAADITSDVMTAFGLSADKAAHSADVFAYAQANANTNVEQMGEAMKYVAPMADTIGWSLEQTAASQMVLANAGLKGTIAGQAFASSLARLAEPAKGAREKMEELGISFFDAKGEMMSLPEMIAELEGKLDGLTTKERLGALKKIFGVESFKHWAILLKAGSKELQGLTTDLENADGAAAEMAAKQLDNVAGKWEIFKSVMQEAALAIYEKLQPSLETIIDKATDIAEKLPAAFDKFMKVWGPLKEGIIGVATAVLTFKGIMIGMTIVGTIARLMEAYRLGTLAATFAQMGLNTAMLMNPFVWVVAGIAALVAAGVLLYRNWDTVKSATIKLWDKLKEADGVVGLVLTPVKLLIGTAAELAEGWMSTRSVWENVWTAMQRAAAASINPIIDMVNDLIGAINKVPGVNIGKVGKVNWGDRQLGNKNHKPKKVKKMPMTRQPRFVPNTLAVPGAPKLPGHSTGLEKVPFDGYKAELHKNESVLTAQQSDMLRKMGVLRSNGKRPVLDTSAFDGKKASASTSKGTGTAAPTKQHITINGGIHIHGAQKTTKQMARELVQNIQHVIAAGGA